MALTEDSIRALLDKMAQSNARAAEQIAAAGSREEAVEAARRVWHPSQHPEYDKDAQRLMALLGHVRMEGLVQAGVLPGPANPFLQATDEELAAVRALQPLIEEVSRAQSDLGSLLVKRFPVAMPTPAPRPDPLVIRPDDPEAREWLRKAPDDSPLAANWYDAALAREFVEKLYAAGAVRVVIAAENIRDDSPSADAIRVQLPADPEQRAALFEMLNEAADEMGTGAGEDTGQDVYYMWWD